MTKNLRKHPREEIQIEVELSFLEDTSQTVVTRNMSQGGLFMELSDASRYPLGELVNVHFKNPLENLEPTSKDAVIVRCEDDGIAIAFIEMDVL